MIPWQHLGSATIPGSGGEMKLMRRGDEFSIRVGGAELMNSRMSASEVALADLSLARIAGRARPRILIGGLGMGFTLAAALKGLPPGASVVVAELVPAVVEWARGPMAALFAGSLDDPRVTVEVADVAKVIRGGGFDAILLDVDNGPEAMTAPGNDGLYTLAGLVTAHGALKPGGVLAVWSQGPDKAFSSRLHHAGFVTTEETVRARGKAGGARHVIWLAEKVPPRTAAKPAAKPAPRGGGPAARGTARVGAPARPGSTRKPS